LCSLHIGQVYSNYKRGLDSRATTFQESRQKSLDIAFDLLLKDNRQRAINSENSRRGGGSGGIEGISVHVFRDLVHELSEYGTNVPSFDGHASNAAHTQQAAAAGSPAAAAGVVGGAGAGGGAGVGGVATIDEEQGGGGGDLLGLAGGGGGGGGGDAASEYGRFIDAAIDNVDQDQNGFISRSVCTKSELFLHDAKPPQVYPDKLRTHIWDETVGIVFEQFLNNFWIAGRNFASCACCCRVALPTHSTRPGANTPFLSTPFSDETRSFAKTGSGQTSGKLRKRGRCR
jgi:hypothetical protein